MSRILITVDLFDKNLFTYSQIVFECMPTLQCFFSLFYCTGITLRWEELSRQGGLINSNRNKLDSISFLFTSAQSPLFQILVNEISVLTYNYVKVRPDFRSVNCSSVVNFNFVISGWTSVRKFESEITGDSLDDLKIIDHKEIRGIIIFYLKQLCGGNLLCSLVVLKS